MALAVAARRVCYHAVRTNGRVESLAPSQTFTRHLVQYHQSPTLLHQTTSHLCKHHHHHCHSVLRPSSPSQVDILHICKRNFFSKWISPASSSQSSEKGEKTDNRVSAEDEQEEEPIIPKTDEKGQPLSNWKRMKIMMKAYGYVIIPVHWVIAPVWFGAFYYTIKLGVDIGPLLKSLRVSDHHIEYLQNSKASTALLAYALYKIFTPLRYTVTLGATEFSIRKLRKMGYIRPPPAKEKSYRDSFKETVGEMKDKVKDIRDSKNT